MAKGKKKKVTLCWDSETLAIVGEIPPSFRSAVIRNVIKRAKSEGWLDIMVRDALGIEINAQAPRPQPTASPLFSPIQHNGYRSFKKLNRKPLKPPARRRPHLFSTPLQESENHGVIHDNI